MITPVQALRKVTQATPARRNPQLGPPSSRPRRCSSPASQPWFAGFLLLALLVALALPSTPARGQGIITGSISGAITDQTGSIIPGATVTALNAETQLSLSAKTNAEGSFLITNVPVGTYTVTIDASGFSRVTVSQLRVSPGQVTPFGKRSLSPGPTSQTIEVRAGAAQLLNTETSQAESIIDSKQLETVPVDGGFDDVALVVPGVAPTHMDDFSNTNGANFSVNGERGRSNNFEIDGQSNNDNSVGGPQVFFSNQDAIQEVQVITDSFSAQYGRNMGAVVNYVTKSGTNRFHGSAFEFYTGSWLSSLTHSEEAPQFGFCAPDESSADGCTEPVVPRFVQNNFGGTFGGPILKDELFFFGSTFWDRTFQSGSRATSGGAVFPDPNGIKELQSAFPSNPGVAALALNGPYAYTTGNPQPIGATSSLPVTDGNTTANIEMSQFDRTLPQYTLDQEQLGRLDYQATSKDRFYLRYFYQDNPTVPAGGDLASAGYINILAATHSVGGDWTHTFSSNLGNQLRYSFQQAKIAFDGGGVPNCVISNPTPCPSAMGFGSSIASIGYPNNLPQGRVVKVTQVQDNASWTRGRHVWLFGGEFDYQNSPNAFLPNSNGSFDFAPGASGIPLRMPAGSNPAANNGISGIVQGNAQVSLTDGDFTSHFTEPDYALYAQDNWKLFPSLTVNLGLRYEYFGQSINLLHNESVVQQTGSDPYWSTSLPLSATTFPAVSPNYKNIEPRVGFAWNPSFLAKVVVHGGFAINVDPSFSNIFINIADSAPVANAGSFNCDGVTSKCLPSNGLTFGSVQAADAAFIPTGGDPRVNPYQTVPRTFRNPMAETYTLGAQYEVANAGVFEVRYVGNHTFRQFQSINANPDLGDVQAAFPQYGAGLPDCTTPGAVGYNRENCNFNVETSVENTAFSIYNGLQTSFTARDFHHVTGILSYTYSRTIDNTSEIFSTGSGGNTIAYAQNPLNTDFAERAVSGNSYPNVVAMQLVYTEPWFRQQNGWVGRSLGGFAFNVFYSYTNGQPFNPYQSPSAQSPFVNASDSKAATNFCDFSFSQIFGDGISPCRPILSNPRASMGSVGINTGAGGYINYVTGASIAPSDVHWLWNNQYEAIARGNPFPGSSRNSLRGDSFNDVDLSAMKNVRLTERLSMQFQMSVFNTLNRAYYGTPDSNIEDSLAPAISNSPSGFLNNFYSGGGGGSYVAGGAFGAGNGNRTVQLGGKFTF